MINDLHGVGPVLMAGAEVVKLIDHRFSQSDKRHNNAMVKNMELLDFFTKNLKPGQKQYEAIRAVAFNDSIIYKLLPFVDGFRYITAEDNRSSFLHFFYTR